MISKTKLTLTAIVFLIVGLVIGASLLKYLSVTTEMVNTDKSTDKKPLYWVAPMDANYQRDQPGKSPMGMDLVPVYEEVANNNEHGLGTVKVAAHVVNNLGVRTAAVVEKHLTTTIDTVGYVEYAEDQLIHVHPRVEGWIETLYIKAQGAPVEKGQALYKLYSPQLVNAQEEFVIALKSKNSRLITAAKNRLMALHFPKEQVEILVKNKKVHQSITFYAPQSGVVEVLKVREGFFVQPGSTIMSIAKLDEVWVQAHVFERDAALIKPGLTVNMTLDAYPRKHWVGRIDYIYPTLTEKTRTLKVRLRFDNKNQQLKANMFANISMTTELSALTIVIPKEAVIRTGKQDRVVLALGNGQFKSINVTIGRVDQQQIEILSGLTTDDRVVTSAQFLLDSESSKTSDFKRMAMAEQNNTLWIEGEINNVMAQHHMLNITHPPVPQWNWPEMTMDFSTAKQLDISLLQAEQLLRFKVTKNADGGYLITDFELLENTSAPDTTPSADVDGVVNAIDPVNRVVNITRAAIEKWSRPAGTFDFIVADNIDISHLTAGQSINFTFEVRDDLVITKITPAAENAEHSNHKGE